MNNPLERLWNDKMDIYRWDDVEVNNIIKNVRMKVDSEVKCQLSKKVLTQPGENGVPLITNTFTLFCSIDANLIEGDEIEVTQQNGKKLTLKVGEGFPYNVHQEFSVKRSDKV
jgi:hypothetical protein